jgi:PilZ domain-containing protein
MDVAGPMRAQACAKEVPGASSVAAGFCLTGLVRAQLRGKKEESPPDPGRLAVSAPGSSVGSLTLPDERSVGIPSLDVIPVSTEVAIRPNYDDMAEDDDDLRETPARRVAPRYIVRIPVVVRVGTTECDGALVDISDSGVRIECKPLRLGPGTSVSLEMRWFKTTEPISMLAKFVRDTPAGCALRFADPDPFLRVFVKLARAHDATVSDRMEKMLTEF